jgi:hypothetical protein
MVRCGSAGRAVDVTAPPWSRESHIVSSREIAQRNKSRPTWRHESETKPPALLPQNEDSILMRHWRGARYQARMDRALPAREATMKGAIMIKCPRSGRDINTGFEADRASFNAMPVFFSRSFCADCQVQHEWFAKDAWVCEPVAAEAA